MNHKQYGRLMMVLLLGLTLGVALILSSAINLYIPRVSDAVMGEPDSTKGFVFAFAAELYDQTGIPVVVEETYVNQIAEFKPDQKERRQPSRSELRIVDDPGFVHLLFNESEQSLEITYLRYFDSRNVRALNFLNFRLDPSRIIKSWGERKESPARLAGRITINLQPLHATVTFLVLFYGFFSK